MKTYPNVMAHFYGQPLAMLKSKVHEVDAFLRSKADASRLPKKSSFRQQTLALGAPSAKGRGGAQMVGRVAILPLFGVIGQRMNLLMDISGGTSTEEFGATFDGLVADKQVRSILIVVDSPGGSVFGVQELAAKILAARDEKKVVAIADSMAASAAYWIASAASEFVVTPGGQVGSIGVIAAHVDESQAEEEAGLKTTLVTAGKYKAELDSSIPLSPEAHASLQQAVDDYYAMFVGGVAKGRNTTVGNVRSEAFGQGRLKLAVDAKASGMVDRIATLEQTVRRLENNAGGSNRDALAAARARAVEVEVAADLHDSPRAIAAARAREVMGDTKDADDAAVEAARRKVAARRSA